MNRWEKERSCHHKLIAIGLLFYWISALYSNWKVALIFFPGLIILGYFLFVILPKGISFLKKFLRKCRHGILGGETLMKCKICLDEKKKIDERNENIKKSTQILLKKIADSKKKKELIERDFIKLRDLEKGKINELNNLRFENLINLNPYEFECLVGKIYEKLGYKVQVTNKSNDGGRDLIMFKGNDKVIVECKKYGLDNIIGRPIIQKFHSAVITNKAIKGIIITTSDFNKNVYLHPAIKSGQIELINRSKLKVLLLNIYGEVLPDSFQNICMTCGEEYTQGFSRIDFCKNGHKGDYITIDDFLKKI